ncbi:hypothetical protein Efla_003244 [Eimeria flavescens]
MTICLCRRFGRHSRSGRKELCLMHIDEDRLDTMLLPSAAVYIMQEVGLLVWPQSSWKDIDDGGVCMRFGRCSRSGRNEFRLLHIDEDRLDTMLQHSAALLEVGLISVSEFGEAELHARLLRWPQSSGKTMTTCVCMRFGRHSRSGRKEFRLMHIDEDRLDTMLLPSAAAYIMQDVGLITMSDLGKAKLHAREKKRSVGIWSDY